MQANFQGTGVALITPFLPTGEVDFPALTRLVEHCVAGGIDFLVALGTTGETATLSFAEQQAVLQHIIHANHQRLPLVVGIGGNDTRKICEQIESQNFLGIDGILSVSPYYNKPTQEGIYRHYMAIAEVAPRPVILYNVPARTGSNVSASTVLRLARDSSRFVAMKEASGDIRQCMEIIRHAPEGFHLLSGDDNMTLPLIACGAKGVISVIAQGIPSIFTSMVRAALANDMEQARADHYALVELTDLIFAQGNPAGIKTVLNLLGITGDTLRLPLVQVEAALREKIAQICAVYA